MCRDFPIGGVQLLLHPYSKQSAVNRCTLFSFPVLFRLLFSFSILHILFALLRIQRKQLSEAESALPKNLTYTEEYMTQYHLLISQIRLSYRQVGRTKLNPESKDSGLLINCLTVDLILMLINICQPPPHRSRRLFRQNYSHR